MTFTEDSIKQLSPDVASTVAGQKLATTAKWVNAHIHESAMWGECQGSGKNPYFTQIDLRNLAFKCSCPSRKFPCKHSLALLFLYVKQSAFFTQETELHPKVAEWLGKREERAEKKAEKDDKPIDEEAQQKRIEQREKKIAQGLEELDLWMKDIIRTGIQSIPQNQYTVFQNMIARMVDSQASGIANMIRNLQEINYYTEGWEEEFMRQFSKIYFLSEVYNNKANLSAEWQQELNSWIGWNTSKEDLAELPVENGIWSVLHVEKTPFERLTAEKTWLWQSETSKFGYQLEFIAPGKVSQPLMTGTCMEAKTVAYPSVENGRIRIKDYIPSKTIFSLNGGITSLEEAMNSVSQQKAQNPLQDEIPFVLAQIRLIHYQGEWYLSDSQENSIKVQQSEKQVVKVWALTQSNPFDAFVIYQYGTFKILSLSFQNKFYTL